MKRSWSVMLVWLGLQAVVCGQETVRMRDHGREGKIFVLFFYKQLILYVNYKILYIIYLLWF